VVVEGFAFGQYLWGTTPQILVTLQSHSPIQQHIFQRSRVVAGLQVREHRGGGQGVADGALDLLGQRMALLDLKSFG
jgi:hypothetical protein